MGRFETSRSDSGAHVFPSKDASAAVSPGESGGSHEASHSPHLL